MSIFNLTGKFIPVYDQNKKQAYDMVMNLVRAGLELEKENVILRLNNESLLKLDNNYIELKEENAKLEARLIGLNQMWKTCDPDIDEELFDAWYDDFESLLFGGG